MPVIINGTTGITTPTYNGNVTAEYLVPVTGFKNRIINGAMTVNQRQFGSTPISTDPVFTLDRWRNSANGGGAFSSTQSSVVPNGQFTNSLLLTVTTADSSIAANDYYGVNQVIEGYNMADFGWGTANAQAVTVSFWVRASISGTYSLALTNIDFTRAYAATYTISATNTWQYITITIPAITTGTWNTTNNQGLYVIWNIGEGSGRQTATPNTWINSYAGSTSSTVNLISTLNATFYITGCQLEVGSNATSFDYRPYGTELALCQRYYYLYVSGTAKFISAGWMYDANNLGCGITFPVTMRGTPTLTSTTGTDFYGFDRNGGTDTFNSLSISRAQTNGSGLFNNAQVSGTAGHAGVVFTNNASASVAFESEL